MADLFDVVVAKKLSGGGGGGGSSDFSTAQVTTIMDRGDIHIPYLYEDGSEGAMVSVGINASGTFNVPMYKGSLVGTIVGMDITTVQVSGNAEWDDQPGTITITGDCTITIS